MAAPSTGKKQPEVREREWTDIELKQFAIGLADDKSEFVKKELDARLLEGKDKEEDLPKKEKQRPS